MRIILIGMPGCGKSTAAKLISENFDLQFIDSDIFIENKYRLTISKLFELVGEAGFRKLEHEALKEIFKSDNFVLATGGGLPCFYKNMELINKNGISIYIKTDEEIIFSRLKKAKRIRPLTHDLLDEELSVYIKNTFLEREKYYKQANYIYNTKHGNIVDFIREKQ